MCYVRSVCVACCSLLVCDVDVVGGVGVRLLVCLLVWICLFVLLLFGDRIDVLCVLLLRAFVFFFPGSDCCFVCVVCVFLSFSLLLLVLLCVVFVICLFVSFCLFRCVVSLCLVCVVCCFVFVLFLLWYRLIGVAVGGVIEGVLFVSCLMSRFFADCVVVDVCVCCCCVGLCCVFVVLCLY